MKKLYRKGTVHPSPSPPPTPTQFHPLSTLPAAILTLVAALSTADKEVLAYLLSPTTPFDFNPTKSISSPKKHHKYYATNTNTNTNTNSSHVTCFTCYCFSCYTTYWARWDSSPNRQLIHEIIDVLEEADLVAQRKNKKTIQGFNKKDDNNNNKKKKKKKRKNVIPNDIINGVNYNDKYEGSVHVSPESSRVRSGEEDGGELLGQPGDEAGEKQGIVRKMMTFVWGSVWPS